LQTFSYSLDRIDEVAQQLLQAAGEQKVLVFRGQMGAGKTTLIKSIAKALQVIDPVSSPTFGIVNEYHTHSQELVFHFDFYRLEDPLEALDIGIEEYFYSGNYCLLEWAEKIGQFLPDRFFLIDLAIASETGRTLTLHHHQNGH
jgi:tRNA threonylcarbamoyladenosine biosynthesis protein TsaE